MCTVLQPLGALSSNNTLFVYDVPPKDELSKVVNPVNGTTNITAAFSLLGSIVRKHTCLFIQLLDHLTH